MTSEKELANLSASWKQLMDACNVRGPACMHVFAQLVAAYSEPHRHYHNLDHIEWMLSICELDVLYPNPFFSPEEHNILDLATWYHDVVYDPRSSENESRSAEVARNSLGELALREDHLKRVCELILITKDHAAPPEDTGALLFIDMDLSILGAPPQRYAKYAGDIRNEYSFLADVDFYQGRRKILKNFLQRSAIFRTAWFKHEEANARANIAAELAQIDEILRTLPP